MMRNTLNPEAPCFRPSSKLSPHALEFHPAFKFNPQASIFTPAFTFNPEASCWVSCSEESSTVKSPECIDADYIHESDGDEIPSAIREYSIQEADSAQVQANESAMVTVELQPCLHHINWLGHNIYEKSFTKPATSLAVVMSAGKLILWKVDDLHEGDVRKQICLRQAFQWIDPVVFTGDRQLLRTLSGTALENAAMGQTEKFYSGAGWWASDHFEPEEYKPQWDPLDENSYSSDDVVFNGHVIDGDIRLPEEHHQEAHHDANRRCADRPAYDEKKALGPRKSPLSRVWNASDLSEYDAPLLNWADEVDEDDWDGANLYEELRRLREELHIPGKETEAEPEAPLGGTRSPSPDHEESQVSSDEEAKSTPPSSVASDQHDELVEDSNDLGLGKELACEEIFMDQASLLAFIGSEDMEVVGVSSSKAQLEAADLVDNDATSCGIPLCEEHAEVELAVVDDSGKEAAVGDPQIHTIVGPIEKSSCLELCIWKAPLIANPVPPTPSAAYEMSNHSTPTIRGKSITAVGLTPTNASGMFQRVRECARRRRLHKTVGKSTTGMVTTPTNVSGVIEQVRGIGTRREQEDRGARKVWAWVKGWFDGRGSN